MYWKDEFARRILEGQLEDYASFVSAMAQYPSLRVKTIDTQGRVVVVQFTEKGEWVKPLEWANNHVASLRARYNDSWARLAAVGSDPSNECVNSCQRVQELMEQLNSDPGQLGKLRNDLNYANENYISAMELCQKVRCGKVLSSREEAIISQFDVNRPKYLF